MSKWKHRKEETVGKRLRKELREFPHFTERQRFLMLKRFANFKQYTSLTYIGRRLLKYFAEGNCKVCEKRPAQVKHHIIQIQHGGPDVWWNRIDLCNFCHAEIHPWLKKGK